MHSPDSAEFRRFWTEDRIDRSFAANSHRIMIGLHLPDSWDRLEASLLVTGGRGKFLQVRHSVDELEILPAELAARFQAASANERLGLGEWIQLTGDLVDWQAPLVHRLAGIAGKYVDRVLGVTVADPGHWSRDFDGTRLFASACDPVRLAERTGLNVIDDLPGRELAAGGSAGFLDALPLWFLHADRNPRGASGSTLLAVIDHRPRWYFLPGSDGLDEMLPDIAAGTLGNPDDRRTSPEIPAARLAADFAGRLLSIADKSFPDQLPVRSIAVLCADPSRQTLAQQLTDQLRQQDRVPVREDPAPPAEGGLLRARVAALSGILFSDQMPVNVPGLTGAGGLRLLGRLTPGNPFSFRNLLAVMADSQSSPMRLRDAI